MAHMLIRSATSWGSVLGGWLATLGAITIMVPLASLLVGALPALQSGVDDPTLALPVVIALFVASLIGGYVAGRLAGYRTSWHGLMSAIWGLFIGLLGPLVAPAAASSLGLLATMPGLDTATFANAVTFGGMLGFAALVVGGWLGGVLAPKHAVVREVREERVERRPGFFDRVFHRRRAA